MRLAIDAVRRSSLIEARDDQGYIIRNQPGRQQLVAQRVHWRARLAMAEQSLIRRSTTDPERPAPAGLFLPFFIQDIP